MHTPALPVQHLVALIHAVSLPLGIIAAGFSLVALVSVWRGGREGALDYFRIFDRMQVLPLLTVMLVVASATVLALLGVLDSNGVTGILSGVAGYVLGGLARTAPRPPTKAGGGTPG